MSIDPKSEYYSIGNIEVQDVIKAKLTPEQYKGWLLGNVIKYSGRANWKGTFERDVEKITVYSGLLREFNSGDAEECHDYKQELNLNSSTYGDCGESGENC